MIITMVVLIIIVHNTNNASDNHTTTTTTSTTTTTTTTRTNNDDNININKHDNIATGNTFTTTTTTSTQIQTTVFDVFISHAGLPRSPKLPPPRGRGVQEGLHLHLPPRQPRLGRVHARWPAEVRHRLRHAAGVALCAGHCDCRVWIFELSMLFRAAPGMLPVPRPGVSGAGGTGNQETNSYPHPRFHPVRRKNLKTVVRIICPLRKASARLWSRTGSTCRLTAHGGRMSI